jgi:hypothetical protein
MNLKTTNPRTYKPKNLEPINLLTYEPTTREHIHSVTKFSKVDLIPSSTDLKKVLGLT